MKAAAQAALRVAYSTTPRQALLDRPGTLALFGFGAPTPPDADPRWFGVLQQPLVQAAPHECWSVAADIAHGRDGDLRWASGGGWRFIAIEVDEDATHDIEAVTRHAYECLLEHVAASPERQVLRIWNYLHAINRGAGDAERYRRFCSARARSMAAHGLDHYPAATAIGHRGPGARLQVYALGSVHAGVALENPRQVSAWEYPRQYGPTAPSFARAMQLPDGSLAISGTAAVIGHASSHVGEVTAQTHAALDNLQALLARAALPAFDATSPLKVYVREPAAVDAVRTALAARLDPAVPYLLLQGDICRSELLVEIDGWRFAA